MGSLVLRVTVSRVEGAACETGERAGVRPQVELLESELGHVFLEGCLQQVVADLCVAPEDVELRIPLKFVEARDDDGPLVDERADDAGVVEDASQGQAAE